jgi:hypothetical protein
MEGMGNDEVREKPSLNFGRALAASFEVWSDDDNFERPPFTLRPCQRAQPPSAFPISLESPLSGQALHHGAFPADSLVLAAHGTP